MARSKQLSHCSCEYCGMRTNKLIHYEVKISRRPARKTISGCVYYNNGLDVRIFQARLCDRCSEMASDTLFKKILQVPDGDVTFTKIRKDAKKHA